MPLDLAQCRIETPAGEGLAGLYRMLGEVFPSDRPLFERLLQSGRTMYTWTPYTLYRGEEPLGNVSLMPLRVWLDARPVDVVGVAGVATAPAHRRRGVARHLLGHCLGLLDRQRLPAVLFTSQPEVYCHAGFASVPQSYLECRPSDWASSRHGLWPEWLDTPTPEDWDAMAAVYGKRSLHHDGKLVRDADYWLLYQTLFCLNPRWRIVACRQEDRWLGYARCEEEVGRLLVSEFCCPADRKDVAERLMDSIAEHARQLDRAVLSLAVASDHILVRLLRSRGVEPTSEGPDAGREVFMVRPAAGQPLGPLARLQWSLADKF